MEQYTLFTTPEQTAYELIRPDLLQVLEANGLNGDYLSIRENKSYHSVYFDDRSVVIRISDGKKPWIAIQDRNRKNDEAYQKIYLDSLSDISSQKDKIKSTLENIIDSTAKEFDCCHRFEACSDAKVCIHPNKRAALSCGYRKILKSGRIFYGRNRNV